MNSISLENKNKLDSMCREVMEKQKGKGMAVAAFTKDGTILYENFLGYRNEEKKLPVDENTIFGLASITKSFVTLCILNLCREGKLNLDDPISKHIPYFTNKNIKGTLKIKDLLCHAGGFFPLYRYCVNEVAEKLGLDEKVVGDLAFNEELAEEGCRLVATQMDNQTEFIGVPGEMMSYCNDGFGILSDIVRRVGEEKSFAEYVDKHIFKPLGMTRSYCEFLRPAMDENSSMLYTQRNGELVCHHDYHDRAFCLNGAGALKSTVADMVKYICLYLNEGKGLNGADIADPYYLHEMLKPRQYYTPDGGYYCYGVITKIVEGYKVYEHSGGLPGVATNMAFCPDAGVGCMVLCNTDTVSSPSLCNAVIALALGKEPKYIFHDYPEVEWSEEFKTKIQGHYTSDEGDAFDLSYKDGKINVTAGGMEKPFKPVFSHTAIIKRDFADLFVVFYEDKEGNVWGARYGSSVYKRKD